MLALKLTLLLLVTEVKLISRVVIGQEVISPCPAILHVNPTSIDVGSWGGTLKLALDEDNQGLFLQIEMDSQINLITNNFGLITTKDNQLYMLEDFFYVNDKEITEIEFNVKYNGANPTPEVKRIYVNGLLICPQSMSIDNRSTERKPALGKFWSQFKDKFTNNSDVTSEETTSKSDETTTSELPQPKIFFFDIEE